MSITVYPYKLTERALEARLAPGLTVLPGQLLRFESEKPVYGKIAEVRVLPSSAAGMPDGVGVVIELLHGVPSLEPKTVLLLTAAQMAREVQALLEPLTHPLRLSSRFSVDFEALGTFTLVEGNDFLLKYEALQRLVDGIKAYRRVLIIDPLGIFEEGGGYTYRKAGRDVRLSVQHVGTRQFLQAFGEMFSPELREVALRAVADHLPMTKGFIGFSHWLNLEAAVNVPLKNLIVQNYHTVMHSQVFADTPDQVLALNTIQQAVCVLDISELPDPWKGLFYQEACCSAFAPDSGGIMPVLLYPEKYLPDLLSWVQMADETGLSLLMLASSFSEATLREKASNYIWIESADQMELQGSLTLGLPIRLPLSGRHPIQERSPASANISIDEDAIEPVSETEYEPYFPPPPSNTLLNQTAFEQSPSPLSPQAAPSADDFVADWGAVEPLIGIDEIRETVETPRSVVSKADNLNPSEFKEVEATAPIVDLSSPPPEPSISFLTAEQLSQLLASDAASGVSPGADQAKEAGATVANQPEAKRVPPGNAPVMFEEMSSELPTAMEDEAHYGYSSFQVDLDNVSTLSLEPQPAEPLPVSAPSPIQQRPAHSPFPTPEEYEKDEFNFDLEPDVSMTSQQSADMAPDGLNGGIRESVSRSLDEFSQDLPLDSSFLDSSMDEPWFEIEPDIQTSSAPMPDVALTPPGRELQEPAVAPEGSGRQTESRTSSSVLEDDEMQDALDLIFPLQPSGSSPESVSGQASHVLEEEPVPIVHRQEMLPSGNQGAFQVGGRVRHATYGVGVIQKIIPMDETVILNIMFEKVGKRLLDPALCDLGQMDM